GDGHALGVLPWSLADAIACIHRLRAVDRTLTELRAPGLGAGARIARKLRTIGVRAFKPAEIGALARTHARDEEGHLALLRKHRPPQQDPRRRNRSRRISRLFHGRLPEMPALAGWPRRRRPRTDK